MTTQQAKNIGNWNFILGLGCPSGMGLMTSTNLPDDLTTGSFEVYFEGEASATISKTFDATANEVTVNTRQAGNAGKDFQVRVAQRSVTGGNKMLNPPLLSINTRERRR